LLEELAEEEIRETIEYYGRSATAVGWSSTTMSLPPSIAWEGIPSAL
jgi:hypothetical protein